MRKTRRSLLSVLMFVLICCMMGGGFPVYAEVNANVSIDPDSPFRNGEFVGIWIRAADNLEEAKSLANEAAAHVGAVQIFLTTNWSNLNPEPWYVLTAGIYASRSEAEMMLPEIQKYDPEAYIKASGTRLGHFAQGQTGSSQTGGSSQSAENSSAPDGWLGTWITDGGTTVEVTQVTDAAVYLIYQGIYADDSGTYKTPYVLPYLNQEKTIAAEPQEILDKANWRYEFELRGDTMIMRSRYPDRTYYRVSGSTQAGTQAGTQTGTQAGTQAGNQAGTSTGSAVGKPKPFYGIWCMASKNASDAQKFANTLKGKGYPAGVYRTSDWSNLNTEFWYVVSAGNYNSQADAEKALPGVRSSCPDAYVKYSGDYIVK